MQILYIYITIRLHELLLKQGNHLSYNYHHPISNHQMANYLPTIKWAKQDNRTTARATTTSTSTQNASSQRSPVFHNGQRIKISNQNTCIRYSLLVLYSSLSLLSTNRNPKFHQFSPGLSSRTFHFSPPVCCLAHFIISLLSVFPS